MPDEINNKDHPFMALFLEEYKAKSNVEKTLKEVNRRVERLERVIYAMIAFGAGAGILGGKELLKIFL